MFVHRMIFRLPAVDEDMFTDWEERNHEKHIHPFRVPGTCHQLFFLVPTDARSQYCSPNTGLGGLEPQSWQVGGSRGWPLWLNISDPRAPTTS